MNSITLFNMRSTDFDDCHNCTRNFVFIKHSTFSFKDFLDGALDSVGREESEGHPVFENLGHIVSGIS